MNIQIKQTPNLLIPSRVNTDDAGYDIYATSEPKVVGVMWGGGLYHSIDYIEYDTGLFISPKPDITYGMPLLEQEIANYHIQIHPRSSISKYNLLLCNSVAIIDAGYLAEIKLRFKYIVQPEDITLSGNYLPSPIITTRVNLEKIYKIGDKCAQMLPVVTNDISWMVVDELGSTARGTGGFGSTGGNSA